jgi:glutathione S-transferase
MLKLYDLHRSGNCYKVRLLLAFVGVAYEKIPIDANAGEHKTAEFLNISPRGQLPVLQDETRVIWDSMAILVYLAARYGNGAWLPEDPYAMAATMQWLALDQNEIRYGLGRARAITLGNPTRFAQLGNLEECREFAHTALEVLAGRLETNDWLVDDAPTIADVACYPYVAMASEGDISTAPFPAVGRWLARIETLPGYVPPP